ncbi:hypothetical protein T4E_4639 [Trichinella pseudospiralis]|uniref:Uncharacterized protein n=1 Tax=Trichinella pseudospiralis TaxID=6337 RepID=A0A0V0XWJ3_TRIPS|nr:hypothetical protein T4E_4639 [Trichinella pseudospiralis]
MRDGSVIHMLVQEAQRTGTRYRISLQTVHEIMYRQVAVHPMIAMPEGLDGRWAFAVVTAGR